MRIRLLGTIAVLTLVGLLAGCSSGQTAAPTGTVTPTETAAPSPTPGDPAAGSKLAPGLYDQPDGSVVAIGTLEYRELEGGFWAVADGTEAEGNIGSVAAVIANAAEHQSQLNALKGLAVIVKGTRLEGASIRMAGPEIVATSVEPASDTAGPAE